MSKQRTPPLICLLGIDPEKSKNAMLPNAVLAAGKRQKPRGGGNI